MTTITIDRALLEQALNALLLPCDRWNKQQFLIVKGAIESLNAALAALATTPKQPRPFVPWSKEAEMLESWAAQPATAPEQMPPERDCICHQYLHLDAYSGGAAPEGLHGALWVVVEGVRKKYVLADQSSEPKDMPALATTPKQPRPFVPWSKEAEMLESWAAQPATAPAQPDELEQLRKDAERYRWCVDNNLVLAGGTREFGWQIAPVGSEWNRFIDAAMKGTP